MVSAVWLIALLIGGLAAAAPAPGPAPHPAMAEEGQASSRKYALDPDPSGSGWTQGSAPAQQGGTSQLSATVLAASKYLLPDRPTAESWPGTTPAAAAATGSSASPEGARTEAIPPASPNFVQTDGIHFTLDGAIKYWSASNDYFLILR